MAAFVANTAVLLVILTAQPGRASGEAERPPACMPAPHTGDAATPFDDEDPGDREAAPGDELAPDDGWLDGTPGKSSMPRDTAAGDELQA